jgi:metal-responsive CopG/Arc/MetJ family transcriptional regulator
MKTAISLPDPLYARVDRHARKLGISRSEFFARAVERYTDQLEEPELTEAIDQVLDAAGDNDTDAFTRQAAVRLFSSSE